MTEFMEQRRIVIACRRKLLLQRQMDGICWRSIKRAVAGSVLKFRICCLNKLFSLFKRVPGTFPDYSLSQGLSGGVLGFTDCQYPYSEFKNDVQAALKSYFGDASVKRGSKAFDVHANTYRVDADLVPCFEHRRYLGMLQSYWYDSGTQLLPDNGGQIINWPRQNYDNGVAKNDATSRRFKAVVRILKRLRNEMVDNGHKVAEPIPSYLMECLVWNVPNQGFGHDKYYDDMRYAIAYLWDRTRTDETCRERREINERKYLFDPSQPWTREQVNSFLHAAWNYIGFK
jgi:hypothetical protein